MPRQSRQFRQVNPASSVDILKKEAKRWLKAVRAGDDDAWARLLRSHPNPPADAASVTLRDVQLAIAREHDLSGWIALTDAGSSRGGDSGCGSGVGRIGVGRRWQRWRDRFDKTR
jgi:hypothetical protein